MFNSDSEWYMNYYINFNTKIYDFDGQKSIISAVAF